MSSLLHLLPIMGIIIGMFTLTMAVPLAFAWGGMDEARFDFLLALGITAASSAALWAGTRQFKRELQPRDGFLLVTLVWSMLPAFGMLPLWLNIDGLSVTDAYFEAMSAFTATGATALSGLDELPLSINVWRCFLQLVGGLGIVVLAVAILPLLGIGGSQLYNAEMPGPMKEAKLTPRIAETARGLWVIYFGISVLCMLAYRAAGMSWPDAFMHACSTVGLGGFSSHDASFGHWNSPLIEAVAIVFMVICGVNFARYFMVWRTRSMKPLLCCVETRLYLATLAGAVALISIYLYDEGSASTYLVALRHTAFHVVSLATTTGYASADYTQWPLFAPFLMVLLGCFCSCAGSTGGGIKMARMLLLVKQARHELVRIVHPRVVNPVTLGGNVVSQQVLSAVLAYMLIYGAVLTAMTLLMLFTGLDAVTAFTAVLACLNNIGPGLGDVGPSLNFQGLTDLQTWICTFAMMIGRLELLAVLVLFTPQFWRK
jgi:trk system potassium uptake protein TrkH